MYLKPYKDHNQCFKWWALLSISKGNFTFPKIYSHHQCIVSNVNPFSQKFMKYCLNITHHVCKTGSRRLKLLTVSAITATTWSLVVYLSESVKIFFSHTTLEIPSPDCILTVWLKCDFWKRFLSFLTAVNSKSQPLKVCTNLLGYYRAPHYLLHDRKVHL